MNGSGNIIREARESAGWTLQRLAAELGVSNGALSMWETGKDMFPSARIATLFKTLPRLDAEAFDRAWRADYAARASAKADCLIKAARGTA